MMLKTETNYALRTLLYLAHIDCAAPVSHIAAVHGISREILDQVTGQLAVLGFVMRNPGTDHSIGLAQHPAAIQCGEVVAAFEGRDGLLPLVLEGGSALRQALLAAEDALYRVLEQLTIADLLRADAMTSEGVYGLTLRASQRTDAGPRREPIEPGEKRG